MAPLTQPYRLAVWMPYSEVWDVLIQAFPSVEDAEDYGRKNFSMTKIRVFKLVDPSEVDVPCGG